MNSKKGVISISMIYSFFLVFCMLLILIMTTYTNNRLNFKLIKNSIKEKYTSVSAETGEKLSDKLGNNVTTINDYNNNTFYYYKDKYLINFGKYQVKYNNIEIGDNIKWLIIGKTSNGDFKLALNDEVLESKFNESYNLAEYTGYKYTINNTHGLSIDSTVKKYLDKFYEDNFKATKYEKYVTSGTYCINRNGQNNTVVEGYGNSSVYFYSYNLNNITSLTCPNEDKITLDIALPSLEDTIKYGYINNTYLINPVSFNSYAYVYYYENSRVTTRVDSKNKVKPVIYLKGDVMVTNNGNEYTVTSGSASICKGSSNE